MIKEAATKTVEQAGDATTCTCVLAGYLVKEGMALIEAGANSQQLKRGMDAGLSEVLFELSQISIPARGNIDRIRQIATVSANNDLSIGDMIADAFKKIGDDYRDWETDRKSTRLNSSHSAKSRMPSSA